TPSQVGAPILDQLNQSWKHIVCMGPMSQPARTLRDTSRRRASSSRGKRSCTRMSQLMTINSSWSLHGQRWNNYGFC
ncbi:hypothetical protein CPB97_003873, partial [Podila verticillata]